jgi:tRNA threonylcarbamoyl adenosine modification protein YjeE
MVKKKSLAWQNCSEEQLASHLKEWLKGRDLTGSLLFLEGEMGTGKSTFVRELLKVLAPKARSQGSPTFPLVTAYETKDGTPFFHIDLYRLKNEDELEESGIESQIEENGTITCVEWASHFPNAFAHWFNQGEVRKKEVFLITIENSDDGNRNYEIQEF